MRCRLLLAPSMAVVVALAAACGNEVDTDAASEVTSTTAAPTSTQAPSTTEAPTSTGAPTTLAPAGPVDADIPEETAEPETPSQLPHVDLVRIDSGESVDLHTLAPASTPILAWFWAPH